MEETHKRQFRDRFERREEGLMGTNVYAVARLIGLLEKYEASDNEYVRIIAANAHKLGDIAENYVIFEEKTTAFMYVFCALRIDPECDDLALSHEFGHSLFSAVNKTVLPDNFLNIFTRARENTTSPENKETFIKYLEFLCDPENERRTPGEIGPLSDILSSIRLYPAVTIAKKNKTLVFPSYHDRSYYFDEEKNEVKLKYVYDENFANFFALTALNCTRELEILRILLGDEWMETMQSELESVATKMKEFGEVEHEKVI